jgi:hypothetical protein
VISGAFCCGFVMAGFIPAIHVFSCAPQDVDARVKPGHDDGESGWAVFI